MNRTSSYMKKTWIAPGISGVSGMNQAQASKEETAPVETTLLGTPFNLTAGPAS